MILWRVPSSNDTDHSRREWGWMMVTEIAGDTQDEPADSAPGRQAARECSGSNAPRTPSFHSDPLQIKDDY